MFSISKAFRVLSLVLVAVLVPATAFAGTTGFTAAKQGASQVRPTKGLKLKKVQKGKAKASKDKARPAKVKVIKRKH